MPGADVEYTATLNDDQVLRSLKVIARAVDELEDESNKHFKNMEAIAEKHFKRIANQGEKSSDKAGKAFKGLGLKIGTVSGITQELTRRFINLGEQAARALLEIAKGGIELNKSLELLEIRATNILGNNEKAAQAFLMTVRETARELRLDYVELAELATTVLPFAESMAAAAEVSARATQRGLALGVPEQNVRRAITEALNGQFISMQKILNISGAQIQKIKALEKEIGRTAAISQILAEELENAGFNVDDIKGSFTGLFKLIQAETKDFQRIFTTPIFEELQEQAEAFVDVLEDNRDDIERVAMAFGDFAASVVELIGTNLVEFIDSLDFERLERTADALHNVSDALDAVVASIVGVDVTEDLEKTITILDGLTLAFALLTGAIGLFKAAYEGVPVLVASLSLVTGDVQGFLEASKRISEEGIVNVDNFNASLDETREILRNLSEDIRENIETSEERKEAVEDMTDADREAGDEFLRQQQLLRELTAAEEESAAALEKIGERANKLTIDRSRKLLEILRDQERERIDDLIGFAEKREDIARENADKIEDIWRKNADAIADAATDLSRDEEDIARKAARDRTEVERDQANERLDIERDYRRELQRIRDRFAQSAAEAERRNDAQAFLAAVRQRDFEIKEAKRDRAEQIEDAGQRAAEQREEVNRQLQNEIEDAQIANRRKLEDLQTRLNRELEAQRINYERDLEEQALNEERKKAERDRANAQELEDFGRKENQKLQDLQKSLSAEFELVRKFERLKREWRISEANRTVAAVNAALARINPFGTSASVRRSSFASTLASSFGRRQEGGPVEPNRPYIVGERGPELFVPSQAGVVMPQVVALPAPPAAQTVSNVTTTVSPAFNVSESLFNDPVAVRKLQNIVLEVVAGAI